MVGPDRHGVVTHALRLSDAYAPLGAVTLRLTSAAGLTERVTGPEPVLLPTTDRLLGDTPEEAATVAERLASVTPLVLALHDIPQPEEGGDWFRRRRATYRRFVAAAARVVVASHTERRQLRELLDPQEAAGLEVRCRVVPLPLTRGPGPTRVSTAHEIATLGFLYPGKGMEELVDAVAATPGAPQQVTNYGAAAPGHEDHVAAIGRYAAERGVGLRVTGYVPDDELDDRLRAAGIPVAPHRHVSASGSVGSWVAAGRRPLVRDLGWFRELDHRVPGSVTVVTSLPAGLADAAADPASTWLADDVVVGPSWRAAAEAHLSVLGEVS